MRISNIVFVLGFLVLTQAATTAAIASEGKGGPLPLLGVSALGQAGAAMGGAFLVWRRRRMAAKKSASV